MADRVSMTNVCLRWSKVGGNRPQDQWLSVELPEGGVGVDFTFEHAGQLWRVVKVGNALEMGFIRVLPDAIGFECEPATTEEHAAGPDHAPEPTESEDRARTDPNFGLEELRAKQEREAPKIEARNVGARRLAEIATAIGLGDASEESARTALGIAMEIRLAADDYGQLPMRAVGLHEEDGLSEEQITQRLFEEILAILDAAESDT